MSATRAIWPSIVLARCSGSAPTGMPLLPFECRAMPSRTSHVRFRPCAVVLEHVDDAQALLVVVEAAGNQIVEDALAGVAERRVAEIVAERDRFGQLLVQPQHLGDAARDLRHLERVRQPRPVVIAGRRKEHLRLVLQAAERLAVDDAIAIALKRRADRILRLSGRRRPACRRSSPPAARGSRARAVRAVRGSSSCCVAVTPGLSASAQPSHGSHAISAQESSVPCVERSDAEQLGERLAEIGERRARAEVGAGRTAAPVEQHRHVLARVIGARRRRIVAVIGGDDQEVVVAQARQQRRQPGVEPLEVGGVAGDVVAVAVDGVEVDEVGEDQTASAVAAIAASISSMPWSSLVVWTAVVMPRPANRSSILPIATTGVPAVLQPVEQRRRERRQREVAAVRGPLERARRRRRTAARSPGRRPGRCATSS